MTPTATSGPCGLGDVGQLAEHLVGERVDGLVHLAHEQRRLGRRHVLGGVVHLPRQRLGAQRHPPPIDHHRLAGVAADEHRRCPSRVDGEPRTDVHDPQPTTRPADTDRQGLGAAFAGAPRARPSV